MKKLKISRKSEFDNIIRLIEEARNRSFSKVNEELVLLYFNVGKVVSAKVAEGLWGEGTVDELADYISLKMPAFSGFNRRGLYRMKQFYEAYSDFQFLSQVGKQLELYFTSGKLAKVTSSPSQVKPLSKKASATRALLKKTKANSKKVPTARMQLSNLNLLKDKFVTTVLSQIQWSSHLHILNKTKTHEEKLFYLLLVLKEKLSVRELERQLNSAVYERSLMGNKIVSTLLTQLPQNLFKDPYIFEFLDLPEGHSENDLEKALVKNLQKFIIEVGKGFTYMGAQFRLQVGKKDYHTDLLFYHRDLQCLVLFELKIKEFEPEFLGKMNFYLESLDRDVKRPHENASIGVLLCKGKDTEVVEYAMARNTSPAMIADYETKLIGKKVLAKKLHQLVAQLSKDDIN